MLGRHLVLIGACLALAYSVCLGILQVNLCKVDLEYTQFDLTCVEYRGGCEVDFNEYMATNEGILPNCRNWSEALTTYCPSTVLGSSYAFIENLRALNVVDGSSACYDSVHDYLYLQGVSADIYDAVCAMYLTWCQRSLVQHLRLKAQQAPSYAVWLHALNFHCPVDVVNGTKDYTPMIEAGLVAQSA